MTQAELILSTGGTAAIEQAIWAAVRTEPRNLTPDEKTWIETHPGLRDSLLEWYESIASINCWTEANQKFVKRLYRLIRLSHDEEQ